jgi:hypothetical protein
MNFTVASNMTVAGLPQSRSTLTTADPKASIGVVASLMSPIVKRNQKKLPLAKSVKINKSVKRPSGDGDVKESVKRRKRNPWTKDVSTVEGFQTYRFRDELTQYRTSGLDRKTHDCWS